MSGRPVHSPEWGAGWLGVYEAPSGVSIWYLPAEGNDMILVEHDKVLTFHDSWAGHSWLLFYRHDVDRFVTFILNPQPGAVLRPVHPTLRALLED